MEDAKISELKRKRARKLTCLTRIRRRAFVIIEAKGSRTQLSECVKEMDVAMDNITEVNDEYMSLLTDPSEKERATVYVKDAENQYTAATERVNEHLIARKDEPASVASSRQHSAVGSSSSMQSVKSKDAEITARMKQLRLAQLEQQLQMEKEEQDLQRRRKLKEATDDRDAACLEASLRKAAENDLDWERKDDFVGEEQAQEAVKESGARPETVNTVQNQAQVTVRSPADQRGATAKESSPHCSLFAKSIPRITLPTFSGDPMEWPRWYGLFRSLVHDQPSLSDTERMVHLQSSVAGLAQQTISGMLFDQKLYHPALQALEERFGREEHIVHANLGAIFAAPAPTYASSASLERFYATVNGAVTVLQSMGFQGDLDSCENLRRVVEKLPMELRREWGKEVLDMKPMKPSLVNFNVWLGKQVQIGLNCVESQATERKQTSRRVAMTTGASPLRCACCEDSHHLDECEVFSSKSVDDRARFVANNGLCFFCLQAGHRIRGCQTAKPCGREGCTMRHHQLLHGSQRIAFGAGGPSRSGSHDGGSQDSSTRRTVASAAPLKEEVTTLLQIVPVRIHGVCGKYRDTHALLDPGAQTSLCCSELLAELDIPGEDRKLCLQNVEGCGGEHDSKRVTLDLSPLASAEEQAKIVVPEAFSVPHINVNVPKITDKERRRWHHLSDLDIPSYDGAKVELLLGANVLEAILQKEVRVGKSNEPVAIRTAFGWTLTGSLTGFLPERFREVMFIGKVCKDEDMSTMLQNWWTTESFGSKFAGSDIKSVEDARALATMEKTTKYLGGRFETGLLWRKDEITLPDNKIMAVRRLQTLEKSLLRQPDKASVYRKVINGYIESGFARKLTPEEVNMYSPRKWYLPHHGVVNPHKPGKLRVVFDAAARYGGTSLNEELLSGPDLLQSLPGILLRFREQRVALIADVEQMYHQVRVVEEDQAALSFLWRDLDVKNPPDVYRMSVTIFGAKSSPASANYVLRKTATDLCGDSRVEQAASAAVQNHFYMDDFLKAEKNVEDAKVMQQEVAQLLAKGGFRLTKWRSNSEEVLAQINKADRSHSEMSMPVEGVLGCLWDPKEDTISIRQIDADVPNTKRGVVKTVAKLFDPLGVVCPFVLKAKIIIQRLWAKGCDWDDSIDSDDLRLWTDWLADLPLIEALKLPRCFKLGATDEEYVRHELHVFGDASELAFGVVAYLTSIEDDGSSTCTLVMSKSRVAPLKQLSVVRLELQAAVMAIRVANSIRQELTYLFERTVFWSDSNVVLKYIGNESRRFHTFVANRIAEIRESSSPQQWRHIPGHMNPADACSRGEAASTLVANPQWISGPQFLLDGEASWPCQTPPEQMVSEDPEVKATFVTTPIVSGIAMILPHAEKFSSWTRYRRVVAWMTRFVRNFVAKNSARRSSWHRAGPLSVEEIESAEEKIIIECQERHFGLEIKSIRMGRELRCNQMQKMLPFVDERGILRVGGRLDNAPIPYSVRHPVILNPSDEVTRLIVCHAHCLVLHSGLERTLAEVRSSYWLPKARSVVRRILHDCMVCRRRRAVPRPPRMADLPDCRFTSGAFKTVGIDYFGPMTVKRMRKTEKRYGVLITCLATRAVHLEVAHNMDTDSFLMALRRFIARRGKPETIFSDNGSNFVGGERELRESIAEWNQVQIVDELSQEHIRWNFIPPVSPHMGGVWERMVGSVKRALRVIPGSQCLTDEVLHTLLTEVEAMLNGRPLTYVSSDSQDHEPLTPNHLILGCASANISPGVFQDKEVSSRRRWRQAQVLAEHYWKRWRREYLPTLLHRQKWLRETRDLEVGDVVLMVEAEAPRGFWPLARVLKVFRGADGRVRSVELRSATGGTYHRPAVKVCFLEEDNKGNTGEDKE